MTSEHCDAVVIGSGFGGAATAHALAAAGVSVLLLERGGRVKRDDLDWDQYEILVKQRYRGDSPLLVKQYRDRGFKRMHEAETVGGMSIFYGGASLRLRPNDFARWPIGYADLEPYYTRTEELLEVHGDAGQDPFEPPRSADYPLRSIGLTRPAQRISEAAAKVGYTPFRIPLAINFRRHDKPLCIKCITCDGFPCKIEAKNDVATTLLRSAQERGLRITPGVTVARLVEENGRITAVECIEKSTGKRYTVSPRLVVLSAGALHSPAILLRSGLERFEQHRFIGRFLMRHGNAVVSGLFPFRTNPEQIFHKQLCFTDFYEDLRARLGSAAGVIQDVYTPRPEVIGHFAPPGLRWLASLASPNLQNLLCIAEDDPQFDNAVGLAPERDAHGLELVRVTHRYTRDDRVRRGHLVARAKEVLRAAGSLASYVRLIPSFSHAVGTVRFGRTADASVLDENCRFRGVDNLFVLDGSFMPTSGGVNPSLTIAANALRVSDHILAHFDWS